MALELRDLDRATPQELAARAIEGLVPGLFDMPTGCRFADRCDFCEQKCRDESPETTKLGNDRIVRCHFPLQAEH